MLRPGVEAELRPDGREQLCEPARRLRLRNALGAERLVASPGGRLSHADERARVAGLDPRVGRAIQPSVDERRERLALAVVLRREELAQVGLVPHGEVTDGRDSGEDARVAPRDRVSEVRQVGVVLRGEVLAPAAVRPARRSPDRQHDLHPAELGVGDELVEVVEAVGRVVGVARARRPRRGDLRPVQGRTDDLSVHALDTIERGRPIVAPAEARIVLEPDEHPDRRAGRAGKCDGEQHAENGEVLQAHRRQLPSRVEAPAPYP